MKGTVNRKKVISKVEGDINRMYVAIKHKGAKLEVNGKTYAISYKEGGWHRISKKHFEILSKL